MVAGYSVALLHWSETQGYPMGSAAYPIEIHDENGVVAQMWVEFVDDGPSMRFYKRGPLPRIV